MQFVIPGCNPEPPARISAKGVHATWAGLHRGELTFNSILAAARQWGSARGRLREYAIGREIHSAPADPSKDEHFHAYFKFGQKVEVRDRQHTTVFDLLGRGVRTLHPTGATPLQP